MTHAGGRPRKTYDGLTVEQWLKGYLSGGSRPSKEIEEVAALRDWKWSTVTRAKSRLSSIKVEKVGYVWHWRDRTIPDLKTKTDEKIDLLSQRVSELTRLGHAPGQVNANGVRVDVMANVDKDGYSKTAPEALGLEPSCSVTPMEINARIRHQLDEGRDSAEIVRYIFDWAYPAANLSESTIKQMLEVNHVLVPSRKKQPNPNDIDF